MPQLDRNYRISAKAIIFEDDSRQKFLICQADDGYWELPGGGIEHGETAPAAIKREVMEEMSLSVLTVASAPLAFYTYPLKQWMAGICYETTVNSLDFVPSPECQAIQFVSADEAVDLDKAFDDVVLFAKQYRKINTN